MPVTVYRTLAEAEADWRALEAAGGILTPYQRFDWISAAVAAGLESGDRLAIVVVHADGRPVALLPLAVERRSGIAVARLAASGISNSDWLVFAPGTTISAEWLNWVLDEAREEIGGLDLVCLFSQPQSWAGEANPTLALGKDPAPGDLYTTAIGGVPIPYIEHRLPKKRRDDIRRGTRRLEEAFGPVRLVRVATADELARVHQAFLAQRDERFALMGVDNLFAGDGFVRLFRDLGTQGLGETDPALCFHALYAGEEIVATACGAFQGRHYSHYINSTTSGPASRYSLMSILIALLMDELTAQGIETFDMGIGDFAYKEIWTRPVPLHDTFIPLTPAGQVAAFGLRASRGAKRAIKRNRRLWGLAQGLRKVLHRLRRP